MRTPSYKEYMQNCEDECWDKYVNEKGKDFTEFIIQQAIEYTESLNVEDWHMDNFFENMCIQEGGEEWSFPDYADWLQDEYNNIIADIGDQAYEASRDEK